MLRRFVVMSLSICAFSSGAMAQAPTASAREPELTTSGRGETRLAPDYAYVTIGVTNPAQNAVDAASENARRFESILGALHSFGLNDRQLLTSRYNLTQNFEYPKNGQPKPSGFVARSTIERKSTDSRTWERSSMRRSPAELPRGRGFSFWPPTPTKHDEPR